MFDEFLDWQDERYLRATGARLAPSTRDCKRCKSRFFWQAMRHPSHDT
jgi:hypothetical protein